MMLLKVYDVAWSFFVSLEQGATVIMNTRTYATNLKLVQSYLFTCCNLLSAARPQKDGCENPCGGVPG